MKIKYIVALSTFWLLSEYHLVAKTAEFKQSPAHDLFSLQATPTWREYPLNNTQMIFNREKWVWVCSLTIKSKNPLKLSMLTLQWKGKRIGDLTASLYQKKEVEKMVVPIQKNHVCDGSWDTKKQQLTFTPNEKIVAVNKYHLVLSFPKNIEIMLRNGRFTVAGIQTSVITK